MTRVTAWEALAQHLAKVLTDRQSCLANNVIDIMSVEVCCFC